MKKNKNDKVHTGSDASLHTEMHAIKNIIKLARGINRPTSAIKEEEKKGGRKGGRKGENS